ncbi:hypothetical protein FNF31_02708 [Cafeteria roenbergensis]|uniref:Uncharacterized protein n=1 Tax=Cafeteria roenbergensis TaxID=33653 RepID=A0A5A8DEB5_CAFRO|nr:hypothetical protein FNF31_02708 [Cafeteria roenbergensis]
MDSLLLDGDTAIWGGEDTEAPDNVVHWQFPGWGEHRRVRFRGKDPEAAHAASGSSSSEGETDDTKKSEAPAPKASHHGSLSQFAATALSGNDLTSSALYVISITFAQAGWLAPVCLLIVAVLLYAYRFVYSEVGGALPVNGGTYTALLHTTSKGIAATAATLSLLSYAATAVVSGTDAVAYLCVLIDTPVESWMVLCLLGVFCLLTAWGIGESAVVAVAMFVLHIGTLITLLGFAVVWAAEDGFEVFAAAFSAPLPSSSGVVGAIFFGFGAALLGVSGFESSANMIEAIVPGQYPAVLRNMHVIVSVLNPLLALATMSVLSPAEIADGGDSLLAAVAKRSGGQAFALVLGIDAFIVLSGAVLTAFVGVGGLMERMAEDECLPQFMLARNAFRGTRHLIPITFFLVTGSLSLALGANVDTLSGVYTISFLFVMQLFAVGALLLKRKRPSLPRPDRARVRTVIFALTLTFLGLLANLLGKPESVQYFALYALGMGLVVFVTYQRAAILRVMMPGAISCLRRSCCCLRNRETGRVDCAEHCLLRSFHEASDSPVVFFVKHPDIVLMNKAVLYVRENEQATRLVFVHATKGNEGPTAVHGSGMRALTGSKVGGPASEMTGLSGDAARAEAVMAGAAAAAPAGKARSASLPGAESNPRSAEGSGIVPTRANGTGRLGAAAMAAAAAAAAAHGDGTGSVDEVAALSHMVKVLDVMYPKLRLDLLVVDERPFGPGLIGWLERTMGIRSNGMFIACPDEDFPHALGSLGGIRVIGRPSRILEEAKDGTPMPRVPFFVPNEEAASIQTVDASAVHPITERRAPSGSHALSHSSLFSGAHVLLPSGPDRMSVLGETATEGSLTTQ